MDKRLNPFRPDLAAEHLRGKVEAARFVSPELFSLREAVTPLLREPRPDAPRDSELLFGERFAVYETDEEGWCWGQAASDSYVGYVPRNALGPVTHPTHRLSALRSFVYPIASIKAPPIMALSLNSRLELHAAPSEHADFIRLADGFYLWASHVTPLEAPEADFVAIAEQLIGVPYLWGGKSSLGCDCSALVQMSLDACGLAAPRDSDMQEAGLGRAINGPLQRGDLVFWKGHVGIMQSESQLLHANGWTMSVYSEALEVARVRILAKGGGDITGVKRL